MRKRRHGGTVDARTPESAGSTSAARWPWLLAFAAVLVALIVGSVVALTSYRTVSETDDLIAARDASATAASRFVRRANNFSSDDPQSYEQSVLPLLTTSYTQEWRGKISELRSYAQQDTTVVSSADVTGAAVVNADADSATVLVVADTEVAVQGSPLLGALRWEVELFAVDGRWLINDYRRVGPGGVIQ